MHRSLRSLSVAAALTAALVVAGTATSTAAGAASRGAPSYTPFTCVVKNVNTCVVTVQLTSNMAEQIGSTMPDSHPWYDEADNGSVGTGGYTITGPGNPQTYWNGVSGALHGTVWSAFLTTGTVSAGAYATFQFEHVTPIGGAPKHYTSISYSYPLEVVTGSPCTVTAVVRPAPPKGHLVLQRRNGTAWANVVGFTYSAKTKKWSGTFRWPYPKHTTKVFRIEATAAPGLLATPSGSFHISTYP